MNFLSCSKILPKSLYYSTWTLFKLYQKWLGENSPFLYFFLMHIHVLKLCRNFEPIPIKIGFFLQSLKLLKNQTKDPVLCTGSSVKFHQELKRENSPF